MESSKTVEIAPGDINVLIQYVTEPTVKSPGGQLITLSWKLGDSNFKFVSEGEVELDLMVQNADNPYLASTEMINYLDEWVEQYERDNS